MLRSKRGYGTNKDKWNRVRFESRLTTEVRVELKLQPEFSGGVLELVVE